MMDGVGASSPSEAAVARNTLD